jgi:colanic acid/amylovoran biosynthesis glycosyltransferase
VKTVIHYKSGSYLPITETWIYGQISNLKRYKSIVYCHSIENLDIYPTEHIRSLKLKEGLGDLLTIINKGWNKVFNFYPLFSFFLLRDKPNLIHAHFGSSGFNSLSLKRLFKLPLVTTFYGFDLSLLPSQYPEW